MKSSFPGLPKETLKFFADLKKNNHREWFEANRQTYLEKVKAPVESLCAAVAGQITRFAPEYATDPKKAMFRIYRDTRFSNNKTPYKDHAGALFWRNDLGKNTSAAFYFAVTDTSLGVAGGLYGPEPDLVKKVRVHLLEHHARFQKLATAKAVVDAFGPLQGESLSRPPKGFAPETAGIEHIKRKAWYFYVEVDAKVCTQPQVLEEIAGRFRKVWPVIAFLNEPLEAAQKRRAAFEMLL